ncbi:PRTRC system protein E [Pseudomonas saponiphila]|jgi:PRTRC genetic system protein E|uniref:PRTRC system protein E n=1 Tax=Pseudomonas saponiphila TaxID=556534 RepID=A0A1H4ZTN0_9PSED|nr:PRTRC system protein E [Pseudomonas saponiphila]SED33463.1 PRTRC system protein E [Pseudomonas saponiphila]
MSSSIFQLVSNAFAQTTSKVSFEIHGQGNGNVKVVLTAKLGPVSDKASKEEKALHAAVATPLVVVGTPGDVESALLSRLDGFVEQVNIGSVALEQVRELASKAVAAATSKAASAPAKSAQKAPVVDEPDGSDEEEGDEPDAVVPPTPAPANSPVLKSFDDF